MSCLAFFMQPSLVYISRGINRKINVAGLRFVKIAWCIMIIYLCISCSELTSKFIPDCFLFLLHIRRLKKANWGDRRSKDAMIIIDFHSTCLHGRCRKWRGNERKRDGGFPFGALLFRVPDFAPTRNWVTIKTKSSKTRGLFLQGPDNVSAPKSCSSLSCLHSRSRFR